MRTPPSLHNNDRFARARSFAHPSFCVSFHRRRAYEGGKVFAQRHTFYDIFFAVLSGRTEENTFSFVVKCACAAAQGTVPTRVLRSALTR